MYAIELARISNSSTTSFIIAVNKSISEQDSIFLEILETTFNHEKFSKNNPTDYRINLCDQIQELQNLRRYGEENIKKIQGILKNKEILMALEFLYFSKYRNKEMWNAIS